MKYFFLGLMIVTAGMIGLAAAAVPPSGADAALEALMKDLEDKPERSSGPDTSATMDSYRDWRVTCISDRIRKTLPVCELTQSVYEAESRMTLLTLIIANDPDTKKRMLVITVPYDVFLTEGLGLVFNGGEPLVIPYDACNRHGCFAKVEFDTALLESFRRGRGPQILVARLDQKVMPIDFSLLGFGEAFAAFEAPRQR